MPLGRGYSNPPSLYGYVEDAEQPPARGYQSEPAALWQRSGSELTAPSMQASPAVSAASRETQGLNAPTQELLLESSLKVVRADSLSSVQSEQTLGEEKRRCCGYHRARAALAAGAVPLLAAASALGIAENRDDHEPHGDNMDILEDSDGEMHVLGQAAETVTHGVIGFVRDPIVQHLPDACGHLCHCHPADCGFIECCLRCFLG
mmetsp:Transcript_31028/g.70981  ORF Transcript_31028/g.70981 Transcript_31028/m.70981 type:complete len:205 (+) Transcript_31028:71-685(+)